METKYRERKLLETMENVGNYMLWQTFLRNCKAGCEFFKT